MARITYGKTIRRVGSSDVTAAASNLAANETPLGWNSEPMYQLPPWGEPLVSILDLLCTAELSLRLDDRLC